MHTSTYVTYLLYACILIHKVYNVHVKCDGVATIIMNNQVAMARGASSIYRPVVSSSRIIQRAIITY